MNRSTNYKVYDAVTNDISCATEHQRHFSLLSESIDMPTDDAISDICLRPTFFSCENVDESIEGLCESLNEL